MHIKEELHGLQVELELALRAIRTPESVVRWTHVNEVFVSVFGKSTGAFHAYRSEFPNEFRTETADLKFQINLFENRTYASIRLEMFMVELKQPPPFVRNGIHPAHFDTVYRLGAQDIVWDGPWTNQIRLLRDHAKIAGQACADGITMIEEKMQAIRNGKIDEWVANWKPSV